MMVMKKVLKGLGLALRNPLLASVSKVSKLSRTYGLLANLLTVSESLRLASKLLKGLELTLLLTLPTLTLTCNLPERTGPGPALALVRRNGVNSTKFQTIVSKVSKVSKGGKSKGENELMENPSLTVTLTLLTQDPHPRSRCPVSSATTSTEATRSGARTSERDSRGGPSVRSQSRSILDGAKRTSVLAYHALKAVKGVLGERLEAIAAVP